MALTPSTMIPLGTLMPEFSLPEPVTGKTFSSKELAPENAILIIFMCNHCPYVMHIADHLAKFAEEYKDTELSIIGINSNNVEAYPDDSPEKMIEEVIKRKYSFPYLFDETQEAAKSFHAACTPDFFLFDKSRKLAYRGQFDASRPGNEKPITGTDLRDAVNSVLNNMPVTITQIPSMGCNIKWKP